MPETETRRPQAKVDLFAVAEPERVFVEEPAQIECLSRDVHAEPDTGDDFGAKLERLSEDVVGAIVDVWVAPIEREGLDGSPRQGVGRSAVRELSDGGDCRVAG